MSYSTHNLTPQIIQQFTNYIKTANLAKLSAIKEFYSQVLVHLIAQSQMFNYIYSHHISELVLALLSHIQIDDNILKIYPEIHNILKEIVQLIHPSKARQLMNNIQKLQDQQININNENKVFNKFINFKQIKQKNPGIQSYHKDQKNNIIINLPQLVNKSLGSEWERIVNHYQQKSQNQNPYKNKKLQLPYNQNKQNTKICLGCTQFMYQQQNIKNKQINKTDIISFPSILKIKKHSFQLKKSICSLLNGDGGVILFGCNQEALRLIAKGERVTQKDKQSVKQQISELFQSFIPKIKYSVNVNLSFIPIAKRQISQKQLQNNKQLSFLSGMYITRLRIWNDERDRVYFCEQMGQLHVFIRIKNIKIDRNQTKQLPNFKSILRYIKKCFKTFYSLQQDNTLGDGIIIKHCFSNHKCNQPLIGQKIFELTKQQYIYQNLYQFQCKYNYVSITIFLKGTSLSKIINYLINQHITKFQFQSYHQQQNQSIQLLFHETSPYKLQSILQKYDPSKGKIILLIIQNGIKIKQKLTKTQLKQINQYLQNNSFCQTIKYYQYIDHKHTSSFLELQSKVSIYYIFLKLRNMNIHGSKLIKFQIDTSKIYQVYPQINSQH